jgi:membrane-associated phospholipid phosphatase
MLQRDILIWIQSFATPWLDAVMVAISFIGDEAFYLTLVPLIYLGVNKKIGMRIAVLMTLSTYINDGLKFFFNTPRPIGAEGIRSLYTSSAPGMSFPSGHAQGSATFWGYVATRVNRPLFYVFAALLVLTIMLSRLYLGVHWPVDVLGGLVFGLLCVSGFAWVEERLARKPLPGRVMLAIGLLLPVLLLISYHEAPGRKMVGFFVGSWVGYLLEKRFVDMELPRRWTRRVVPVLLGVAAVFFLRESLKGALPPGGEWEFIRYLLVGLIGTFAVPWLFVRLGWYPSSLGKKKK